MPSCPRRCLQTSIFNAHPHVQKDPNSNEIFVMGAAYCAAPMTKVSLLLVSFYARYSSLKIDVCKKKTRGTGPSGDSGPDTKLESFLERLITEDEP